MTRYINLTNKNLITIHDSQISTMATCAKQIPPIFFNSESLLVDASLKNIKKENRK